MNTSKTICFSSTLKTLHTLRQTCTFTTHKLQGTITHCLGCLSRLFLETRTGKGWGRCSNRRILFRELWGIVISWAPFQLLLISTRNWFTGCLCWKKTLRICMESDCLSMEFGRRFYWTWLFPLISMGNCVLLSLISIKSGLCYWKKPGPKFLVRMIAYMLGIMSKDWTQSQAPLQFMSQAETTDSSKHSKFTSKRAPSSHAQPQPKCSKWPTPNRTT